MYPVRETAQNYAAMIKTVIPLFIRIRLSKIATYSNVVNQVCVFLLTMETTG